MSFVVRIPTFVGSLSVLCWSVVLASCHKGSNTTNAPSGPGASLPTPASQRDVKELPISNTGSFPAKVGQDAQPIPRADVERPPQFVLMAFDGGAPENDSVAQTTAFARDLSTRGVKVHFTYFLSAAFFINSAAKALYAAPRQPAGASNIGFASSNKDILARVREFNTAFDEGHEMASHAVGHFDGSQWTSEEWQKELASFHHFVFDAFGVNAITSVAEGEPSRFSFSRKNIVGFRAPYLANGPGLYDALAKAGFRYDTSKVAEATAWPKKEGSVWLFPLAMLKIVGSNKPTLSMDYNFFVAQSQEKEDVENGAKYTKEMMDTYLQYFEKNYYGNRAPVHIGHHLKFYNGGAYWRALRQFATKVCGMAEVKCVTYRELADYLDALPATKLASFRKGNFPRLNAGGALNLSDSLSMSDTSDFATKTWTQEDLRRLGYFVDTPRSHSQK